jgi:hypothetical protein
MGLEVVSKGAGGVLLIDEVRVKSVLMLEDEEYILKWQESK